MALHIKARIKSEILFNRLIEKIRKGEIDTWTVDVEVDFTHKPIQWFERAWLRRSSTTTDCDLVFGIVGRKDESMSKVVYAVYHGRFAEMLLTHFDEEIESISISSLPEREVDLL